MWAALGWAVWLAVAPSGFAQGSEPALAPLGERQKLRTLASDLARAGERAQLEPVRAVLLALGDDSADLERLAEGWERSLAGAKSPGASRAALANKLRRLLEPLVGRLAQEGEPRRTDLARALLVLDREDPAIRTALGHVRGHEGAWLTPEEARWDAGARAVEQQARSSLTLDFDIEQGESQNPLLRSLVEAGRFVRAGDVELHSDLPPVALERILRQALRAADLSRALAGRAPAGSRPRPRRFVFLSTRTLFRPALEESLAHGGLGREELEETVQLDLDSYLDQRGFEVVRWLEEATLSAVILWRLQRDWIPEDAQPCLRVGHANWVCLRVLGTSLPVISWREDAAAGPDGQRSSAVREDALQRAFLWRTARRTLWGCRAWMARQAREGRDLPWARAMLDQDGKIRDEALLKTTLVAELLQQEGALGALLEATKGVQEPLTAFERALGAPLPDLEARWKRWLLPAHPLGVLQALAAEPPAPDAARRSDDALLALNQARANALKGQQPEIPVVVLEPELSRAAELHARYLTANPAQKLVWPAVHEERADAPGFTPEGALAGSRSLVSFEGDGARAVQGWLGTFYHRLPLLHPGLFGAGLGQSEEVVVLDVGSLVVAPWKDHVVVWPLADAEGVPRAFAPEIPNPVPGQDMTRLGQPVSVQLFFVQQEHEVELQLELFAGDLSGAPVAAFALSPRAPLEANLAPPNAWGLIPERWLEPHARYTARARWSGGERVWSFTTRE